MPPKKSDAAKSSSSVPPLEPHDPSAEPEVSAGAREVEEREFAIGRLKTQLGAFRMRAPCSRSRPRRFATRWPRRRRTPGTCAHPRRELITAEALVNTLAASVAERESEVKAQADAFESALERARASDAVADEALVSALKRHDLEAEKHRKREMDRTNLLAAIDGVSETLAFESREERNRMALLEGEALSERAALERSHELIIRETSLRLIRRTDQQLVVTTKRAIIENERRGDALAMASARCEREMRAHETARRRFARARKRRGARAQRGGERTHGDVTAIRRVVQETNRGCRARPPRVAENVSQIQRTPSSPTSRRGAADVAAARSD